MPNKPAAQDSNRAVQGSLPIIGPIIAFAAMSIIAAAVGMTVAMMM